MSLTKLKKDEKGQSLVEMALVLPILLMLLCGILDFGWLFYAKLSISNAAREGARYAAVNVSKGVADITAYTEDRAPAYLSVVVEITPNSNAALNTCQEVVVKVSSDVPILTPIAGIFTGGDKMAMASEVTMRNEMVAINGGGTSST